MSDRGATQVLGEHPEVGVVAREHRTPEPTGEQLGERLVDPPQVRREPDRAVAVADRTGHGHPDAEAPHAPVCREHLLDHLRRGLDDVLDVVLPGGVGALPLVEHVTTERHEGGHDPVDTDVDGHGHVVALRLQHERRATGPAYDGRLPLGDQAQLLEGGGEPTDGAAVEPEVPGQRGAAGRTLHVHPGQQRTEVVAAQLLLPEARLGGRRRRAARSLGQGARPCLKPRPVVG